MTENNHGVTKERVRQLEKRTEKVEGDFKDFITGYSDEREKRAVWRGQIDGKFTNLETKIGELKGDLEELKGSFGRRKSDQIKIWVALIMSAGLLIATVIDKINW